MPTRTLRKRAAAPLTSKDYTNAIAYHSSAITIFWLLFLFLSLGFAMLFLVFFARLTQCEQDLALLNQSLVKTQLSILSLQQRVQALAPPVAATLPTNAPTTPAMNNAIPGGLLDRGALSPDGTKYAGYDDTTAGKLGVGVETLADKKLRHVVLFNPKTESSGAQISSQQFGVRWTDNSTIEYDVLVNNGTQTAKETRTVKIYF